jgi:hypothetical protein
MIDLRKDRDSLNFTAQRMQRSFFSHSEQERMVQLCAQFWHKFQEGIG